MLELHEIEAELGWRPPSLWRWLRRTIDWYKNYDMTADFAVGNTIVLQKYYENRESFFVDRPIRSVASDYLSGG